jgi:hypothetical protein
MLLTLASLSAANLFRRSEVFDGVPDSLTRTIKDKEPTISAKY